MSDHAPRILLAESNSSVAEAIVSLLTLGGYPSEVFTSGLEAWHQIEESPGKYDLLILDYEIAELNGTELLTLVRNVRIKTPAIVLTKQIDGAQTDLITRLDVVRILQKPQQIGQLLDTINNLFGRKSQGADLRLEGSIPARSASGTDRKNILIVEDDISNLRILMRIIRKASPSASLLSAVNLAQALAICETTPIHLLVCDLFLPDGNGLDFISDLLCFQPEVRIIINTSSQASDLRQKSHDLGILHYCNKPVKGDELERLVSKLMLPAEKNAAFQAQLSHLTPMDILQLKCMMRASEVLNFAASGGNKGEIHLKQGEIVYAATGDLWGLDAFREMIRWRSGLVYESCSQSELVNITEHNCQKLLLEAVSFVDEHPEEIPGEEEATLAVPGWEDTNPPGSGNGHDEMPVAPQEDAREREDDLLKPATNRVPDEPGGKFVLATHEGKILDSCGTEDPEGWLPLIKSARELDEQLAELEWGPANRLEFVGSKSCVIAGLLPDRVWLTFSESSAADPLELEQYATDHLFAGEETKP